MNEEIKAGLKNALDRGESIQKALNSFINAGYNPKEVQEAASSLSEGALSAVNSNPVKSHEEENSKERLSVQSLPESPSGKSSQAVPVLNSSESAPKNEIHLEDKPKSRKFLWISIISVSLIIIAGIITYILLK